MQKETELGDAVAQGGARPRLSVSAGERDDTSLAPTLTPTLPSKVVIVYELSEQRACLVPVRAVGSSED